MKNDLTTGAWQHDIGCPISIALFSTSDVGSQPIPSKLTDKIGEQETPTDPDK
jgi:hypothetical protein